MFYLVAQSKENWTLFKSNYKTNGAFKYQEVNADFFSFNFVNFSFNCHPNEILCKIDLIERYP